MVEEPPIQLSGCQFLQELPLGESSTKCSPGDWEQRPWTVTQKEVYLYHVLAESLLAAMAEATLWLWVVSGAWEGAVGCAPTQLKSHHHRACVTECITLEMNLSPLGRKAIHSCMSDVAGQRPNPKELEFLAPNDRSTKWQLSALLLSASSYKLYFISRELVYVLYFSEL